MTAVVIAVAAFGPMVGEAILSSRHDTRLRQLGAVEAKDDVHSLMRFAYPLAFACLVVEAWLRRAGFDTAFVLGASVFVAAKALKYWAIATLGERWTFRVLVPPGSTRIVAGPYRFVRHPNYAAVIGELVGAALMAHAWVTGPIVTAGFGLLILARVRVEERALH